MKFIFSCFGVWILQVSVTRPRQVEMTENLVHLFFVFCISNENNFSRDGSGSSQINKKNGMNMVSISDWLV